MSENLLFEIGGVPTDDPWGRWKLAEASHILPAMGSLSVTAYRAPGQQGETQSVLAPRDPKEFPVQVIFYPVEGGTRPRTASERAAVLTKHIDDFQQAIRAAAQEHMGLIRLRKTYAEVTENRIANARMISDSVELRPAANEAVLTMLFRIPSGAWTSPSLHSQQWSVPARSWTWVEYPVGSAGAENLQVAIEGGQAASAADQIHVVNEAHTGFVVRQPIPANRWMVVNVTSYAYELKSSLDWGGSKHQTVGLLGYRRGTGKALSLFPSATMGMAKVGFWLPNAAKVALLSRKAWY